MSFKPRTTAPGTSDNNWRHTSYGGKNSCIHIAGGSVLPNCVGYAWGRFMEIMGSTPRLSRGNAEDWWGATGDGYSRGKTPKLGAVICWSKGRVGDSSDGAGHVAIVEQINSNGSIRTSNSAYKGTRFYMQDIGSSYALSGYGFQGFIYNPAVGSSPIVTPPPSTQFKVRVTASVLNIRTGPGTNYGTNGSVKLNEVYTITQTSSGPGANSWGKLLSGAGWISLDFTVRV